MAFTDRETEKQYVLEEAMSLLSYFHKTKDSAVVSYTKEGLIYERVRLLMLRYEALKAPTSPTA